MPKIDAATVKEHRNAMMTRLVDVAEQLLVSGGIENLTASAVTNQVGIARNSLYRYVDSVDELRGKVVARYLPGWTAAVATAVADADTPEEKVVAYVAGNLAQAATSGHGWLMNLARGLEPSALADVAQAHASLREMLVAPCREIDPEGVVIMVALVQAVVQVGFDRLDAGDQLAVVSERCCRAVRAILAG